MVEDKEAIDRDRIEKKRLRIASINRKPSARHCLQA